MTITLPLPPKELHPNGRYHHMAKARATKQYRKCCAWAAFAAKADAYSEGPFPWTRAIVQAVFYFKRNAVRDGMGLNSSLKAAIDALQVASLTRGKNGRVIPLPGAGVIVNDSGVTLLPAIQAVDAREPRVELTVRSA